MYNHAVRVTLSYEDFKTIIDKWATRANRVLAYQHDADDKVSKTHVHIGLFDCEVKAEALKRMWKDAPGKGNEFWSWTDVRDISKFPTYMSKGRIAPVFIKNFSEQEVEESRQAWVEPNLGNDKSGKITPTQYLVNKVIQRVPVKDDDDVYGDFHYGQRDITLEHLLKTVRSETMKVFWGENQQVPHTTQFKIVAGTAFIKICENINKFEEGIHALQNLWY